MFPKYLKYNSTYYLYKINLECTFHTMHYYVNSTLFNHLDKVSTFIQQCTSGRMFGGIICVDYFSLLTASQRCNYCILLKIRGGGVLISSPFRVKQPLPNLA